MAPKRKHDLCDDVMAFFIDQIIEWTPKSGALRSFERALIRDAHEWGEARVRAELMAMQLDPASTAAAQLKRLQSRGKGWYCTGYRAYLVPESTEWPDALLDVSFRTNKDLFFEPEEQRRRRCRCAAETWWADHATPLFDELSAKAHAEAQRAAAPKPAPATTPTTAPATAPAPAPAAAPSPAPAAPAAPARPATPPRRAPTGPPLPKPLATLLACPAKRMPSNPRKGIEDAVTLAFDTQRMLRVWDERTGNGPPRPALHMLETRAHVTEACLKAHGLQAVYGREEKDKCEVALLKAGMRRLGGGAYNSVWVAGKPENLKADALRKTFPEHDIAARFESGELVLRVPHAHTPWMRFEDAVGEATNMLFTALCGFGPKVALLSYARKVIDDPDADEEGVKACRYKMFALLERATESVDRRYSTDVVLAASATSSATYFKALLVCLFQISWHGYVHLDGTLRNFVDTYPLHLPAAIHAWRVNVIDVEGKHFRRLCPTASIDWCDLFLTNLLITLTYLKIALGQRWNPECHWQSVRAIAEQLIVLLRGKRTLPAIMHWQGAFTHNEQFPEMLEGKYVGDTHEAAMHFLKHQMRYYLLKQPIEQCMLRYVNKLHHHAWRSKEMDRARGWYEGTYRATLYPSHAFFREKLELGPPREDARLLVLVLFDFLDTPHGELQARYGARLPPMKEHSRSVPPEVLWGV